MPTYNRRDMMIKAISSIRSQTFQNWELIVIDDGGNDGSREACEGFSDVRIRYIWKLNEERSIARNTGIKKARGRYINFLDSDDYFEANHLENAYACLQSNKLPPVLHVGFCYVNIETGVRSNTALPTSSDTLASLLYENPLTGSALFVKSYILREFGFLNSKYAVVSEDWYVWIRLAVRYMFLYSPEVTACVVQHQGRSIAVIDPFKYEQSLNCLVDGLNKDYQLRARLGDKKFNHVLGYQVLGIAQNFLINKVRDRSMGLYYIWQAVRTSPRVIFSRRFLACVKKLMSFSGGRLAGQKWYQI